LGLGDSTDPTSVMYGTYQGPRTGPSAGDIAELRSLYGARAADSFEGANGNDTFATASTLGWLSSSGGLLSVQASADLGSATDRDVYRFQAPLGIGGLTLTLHRDGLSAVTPRVTVYDSFQRAVATVAATDPTSGDLTLQVNGVLPLSTYYVQVQ